MERPCLWEADVEMLLCWLSGEKVKSNFKVLERLEPRYL